jgi:hypothetical protein
MLERHVGPARKVDRWDGRDRVRAVIRGVFGEIDGSRARLLDLVT